MKRESHGATASPRAIGAPAEAFGPWNPGIASQVPAHLLPLCTIFRPEHSFTSVEKAAELRDLTGLSLPELVAFRPERLALHELLIRVTADLSVSDGERIEDLGINFREIVRGLLSRHVAPNMDTIVARYAALRGEIARVAAAEIARLDPLAATPLPSPRGWRALLGPPPPPQSEPSPSAAQLVTKWEQAAHGDADPIRRSAFRALARVVSALLVRHGVLWGDRPLIAAVATDLACNDAGSDAIGRLIEPWLAQATAREGLVVLPAQSQPLVMNTKGPSASGKSSLRPLQRRLAGDLGVRWSEFALVSPDIWRKQLLDYGSLGPHYKYGGAFTGDEIQIVDQKLDRYVARKAERGAITHLLIDRFRFDSFAADSDEAGSNLLTRFGRVVYLFFMITPPASLVERAWQRGLDVGRYKAVDDTLAHAVEAYSGMPGLFFTWIDRADKRVHFEFLDNSVTLGETPRTIAFGWNDAIHVLDVKGLLDIERYRRVDIDAKAPRQLYRDPGVLAPNANAAFLRQCVERFRRMDFVEQQSGRVYLRLETGVPVWSDGELLRHALADADTRAGLEATVPAIVKETFVRVDAPLHVDERERTHTLGAWGKGT
jgi:hypothetical protein